MSGSLPCPLFPLQEHINPSKPEDSKDHASAKSERLSSDNAQSVASAKPYSNSMMKGSGEMNKDKNEQYFEFCTSLLRRLLRPIGLWPLLSNASIMDSILKKFSIAYTTFLLSYVLIPNTLRIIPFNHDLATMLSIIGLDIYTALSLSQYLIFLQRGKDFKICVEYMLNDLHSILSKEELKTMTRCIRRARSLTKLCLIPMFCGEMLHVCFGPHNAEADKADMNASNITEGPLEFLKHYIYFDSLSSPVHEMIVMTLLIYHLSTTCLHSGTCGTSALLSMYACGQFEIIKLRLKNLLSECGTNMNIAERKLAAIVEHHTHVLRFADHVEKTIRPVLFTVFFTSTFLICFCGYHFLTGLGRGDIKQFILFFTITSAFTSHLFVFCMSGEYLSEQSRKVGEAAYFVEWYEMPPEIARYLILLLVRSSRPSKLTAGKFIDFTILTFSDILKAAATYLNILLTFTE